MKPTLFLTRPNIFTVVTVVTVKEGSVEMTDSSMSRQIRQTLERESTGGFSILPATPEGQRITDALIYGMIRFAMGHELLNVFELDAIFRAVNK